jgi:hypothetical protein
MNNGYEHVPACSPMRVPAERVGNGRRRIELRGACASTSRPGDSGHRLGAGRFEACLERRMRRRSAVHIRCASSETPPQLLSPNRSIWSAKVVHFDIPDLAGRSPVSYTPSELMLPRSALSSCAPVGFLAATEPLRSRGVSRSRRKPESRNRNRPCSRKPLSGRVVFLASKIIRPRTSRWRRSAPCRRSRVARHRGSRCR